MSDNDIREHENLDRIPMEEVLEVEESEGLNQETQMEVMERTLFLNGTIAEDSWFDDDVTPQMFKKELVSGSGDLTVWINSSGGDCVAAVQIYNMLREYQGTQSYDHCFGRFGKMQKEIDMLSSVKDSIINVYELKTGLSRTKFAHLLEYINDMYAESKNDDCKYATLATQEDFDHF